MRTLSLTLLAAIILQTALHGQTTTRHVLDDRIDSLRQLLLKAPPDTARVALYLELGDNFLLRYKIRGYHSADSLSFFQTMQSCRSLSNKLGYAYGTGNSLLTEARMYGSIRKNHLCQEKLKQAFSHFSSANYKKGLAEVYIIKSIYHPQAEKLSKKRFCDSAVQLARECADVDLEAYALKTRADMYMLYLEFAIAVRELLAALELQKRSGDKKIHHTTNTLTQAYILTGKHKEAMESAIATIDLSRKVNDTVYIQTFYSRLGAVYDYMDNAKEAYNYYNKALTAMFHANYNRSVAISLLGLMAECLSRQGKHQEALDLFSREIKKIPPVDTYTQDFVDRTWLALYCNRKNFIEAEKYLLKLVANLKKEPEIKPAYKLDMFVKGAAVYYELKQYNKAAWYADTGYTMARQAGSRKEVKDVCLTLYKLELVKGNYKTALKYFGEYKNQSDSFQQETADKRLIELSVKYETDQKNSQLRFLTAQTKLHRNTIQQGKTLRNFIIAGSVLLILLLLLIFNRYRVKQRANKQLQEKQEEINRQNQALEKMLQEKEWLMKEVNHRVKNNLQVVMSLLNTQSAYLKDEAALYAIEESRHRVHAISLIHRKLYQNDRQLTRIRMAAYIKEVAEHLSESMNTQNRIQLGLFIDPIELDVTEAVPVGLIINEAVTNAVKYAFSENRKGQINISMYKKVTGSIELTIQDDGIGLPPDFDWQQTESIGMSLMQGLSRQLDGKFDLIQQNGITIKITFEAAKALNL